MQPVPCWLNTARGWLEVSSGYKVEVSEWNSKSSREMFHVSLDKEILLECRGCAVLPEGLAWRVLEIRTFPEKTHV